MDPNATLEQLRALMDECNDEQDWDSCSQDTVKELFEALDEWICRGGFLPQDWARKPSEG